MAEFGKQLKSVMSSIRVADRITNLIRSDERSKGVTRTDVYRVAVAIAPPPSTGGDAAPIGRDFKLSLVEKRSSDHVHTVIRAWPIIKQIVLFIRGVVPKLDVPPLPVEAAGSAPALVAEDRRKYIQTYANAALMNTAVANLKEFQDLIGFTEFTSIHAHDAPQLNATLNRVQQVDNASFSRPTTTASEQSISSASFSSPLPAPQRMQSASHGGASSTAGHATSALSKALEECFRVMDVGGAGYLTPDDMKSFLDMMMEQTQRSKVIVARIVKSGDAIAATDFASLIMKAAQECSPSTTANQTVEKWIAEYQNNVFAEVYAAIGGATSTTTNSNEEHREYDKTELRTLQFVLRVSGIRIITEAEIDREESLSLPVNVDDFCKLMSLVVAVIPFDDVIRALEVSQRGDHAKLVALVCKNASSAGGTKKQALRNLQDAIAELGGGSRRLGKCGNCEAAEQRTRAMKLQLSELEEENARLRQGAVELEGQLTVKNDDFVDAAAQATTIIALEQEVASLRELLATWELRAAALDDRVKELELMDAPHAATEATPATIYEVTPTVFSGSSSTIMDLPGSLTIPTNCQENQVSELQLDVYFSGKSGVECVACRARSGARLLGLRFENGVLSCLNSAVTTLALPVERWVRLTIVIDSKSRTFLMKMNGIVVWNLIPLKCGGDRSDVGIDLLDIYPRHEVLYCYANIQFLVHS